MLEEEEKTTVIDPVLFGEHLQNVHRDGSVPKVLAENEGRVAGLGNWKLDNEIENMISQFVTQKCSCIGKSSKEYINAGLIIRLYLILYFIKAHR